MFDGESIHAVYTDIVNTLKMKPDIELGVLQTLSYCFYEILDNVLTHSLSENEIYRNISEAEALVKCMHDKVTDGKGMGFGLYSTACLIRQAGIVLKLHSGRHLLTYDGVNEWIEEADYWQGTVMYFELHSDKEIDPNQVLENRTDAVSEFNDEFLDTEDIDNLW